MAEDNRGDVRLVREMLANQSIAVVSLDCAGSLADAMVRLRAGTFDVVLAGCARRGEIDLVPGHRKMDDNRRTRRR